MALTQLPSVATLATSQGMEEKAEKVSWMPVAACVAGTASQPVRMSMLAGQKAEAEQQLTATRVYPWVSRRCKLLTAAVHHRWV